MSVSIEKSPIWLRITQIVLGITTIAPSGIVGYRRSIIKS